MNIKTNLPSKINLTSKALVIAATRILASETGREIRPNLKGFRSVENTGCCIGIDTTIEGPNPSICFWARSFESKAPTCNSLEEFFSLIEDKPIKIGDYEVTSIDGSGVKVGCTFVPWETIELLLSKKPKASYRMLDDDEKGSKFVDYPKLNEIESQVNGEWYPKYAGDSSTLFYRTKLSREALAALREARK